MPFKMHTLLNVTNTPLVVIRNPSKTGDENQDIQI